MNEISPDVTALARLLILFETPAPNGTDAVVNTGEHAWNRLEQRLTTLIGPAGFAALATRALALARPRHPVLASFTYGTTHGARLDGLRAGARAPVTTDACDVLDALVSLTAHFLSVLIRLIGADLVVHLVQQAWPELPPEDVALHLETQE